MEKKKMTKRKKILKTELLKKKKHYLKKIKINYGI